MLHMERIKLYPIRTYTALMLLMLIIAVACRKDKIEPPAIAFKIAGYYPNSGMAGTLITVEGEGFGNDLTNYSASISGVPAEVISATPAYLVLRAPAGGSTGKLEIKYQGQAYTVGQYTYQELSLQKIFPVNGPVGTNIRISGAGFGNTSKPAVVTINGTEAVIVSLTDTLIIATVPDKASSGPVEVKVNGKSSAGPVFKVQMINEILPKTGGKGTKVTLKGSGFEKDLVKNQVTFKGKMAQVLEAAEDHLVVVAPDGVETGIVLLKINDVITEGPVFTVVPKPVIDVVNPLSGLSGTEMTVTGTGFSEITGETKVFINDKELPVSTVTKTAVKLIIPPNIGTGKVNVSVNGQTAEGPVFTDQALGIIRLNPESGAVGTEVTIFGTGFGDKTGDNIVTFNNTPAQVTSASTTQLKVIVPVGAATGPVKIRVNGKEAVSSKPFAIQSVSTLTSGLSANTSSIAVGLNGEIYATDPEKNQVVKVSANGMVTLFAGSSSGQAGNNDGSATSATFNRPIGITADNSGNLYVVEENKTTIRKITPGGQVSTFSTGLWIIDRPAAITADLNNNTLYVNGTGDNYSMVRFKLNGGGRVDFSFSSPNLAQPKQRIGVDASGAVYYVAYGYPNSNSISTTKDPNLKIGSDDEFDFKDGDYSSARFNEIYSIVVNNKNQLLIADYGNNALRLVDQEKKVVSTIFKAAKGYQDGALSTVKFGELTDIAIAPDGTVYVLDKVNRAIRKVVY
eukprot:gene21434-25450_t